MTKTSKSDKRIHKFFNAIIAESISSPSSQPTTTIFDDCHHSINTNTLFEKSVDSLPDNSNIKTLINADRDRYMSLFTNEYKNAVKKNDERVLVLSACANPDPSIIAQIDNDDDDDDVARGTRTNANNIVTTAITSLRLLRRDADPTVTVLFLVDYFKKGNGGATGTIPSSSLPLLRDYLSVLVFYPPPSCEPYAQLLSMYIGAVITSLGDDGGVDNDDYHLLSLLITLEFAKSQELAARVVLNCCRQLTGFAPCSSKIIDLLLTALRAAGVIGLPWGGSLERRVEGLKLWTAKVL